MSTLNLQKGVGLIEVLVAMLLLAIGIMGFVALQVRATAATTEALKRSDALVIMQGLAERIRLNPAGTYVNNTTTAKNCITNICNANEQALWDISFFSTQATGKGMSLATIQCPQTSTHQGRTCIITAWDKTTATKKSNDTEADTDTDCINAKGIYLSNATCLLMETY